MLSVTALSTYSYCQRKLYLEKVLKLVEIPKEALIKGSIKHDCFDQINKTEENIVKNIDKKIGSDQILKIYTDTHLKILKDIIIKNRSELDRFNLSLSEIFSKTWPIILSELRTRSDNIFSFMQKTNLYGEELWQALTPKMISEYSVTSPQLNLRGRIDQIEVHKDNTYIPVELKSGKCPDQGVWPSHKIQLGAYALLLENKHNTQITSGIVRYLDADKTINIPINPFLKQEVKDIIKKIQELIENKKIPSICSNINKCNACGLKEKCFAC